MSYTSPGTSDKDMVRSLIGDTSNDVDEEQFTDTEITDHLAAEYGTGRGQVYLVASTLLMAALANFQLKTKGVKSKERDEFKKVFGTPVEMKKLAREYRELGNALNPSSNRLMVVLGKS